jgi:hypothetical protein
MDIDYKAIVERILAICALDDEYDENKYSDIVDVLVEVGLIPTNNG